MAEPIENIEGKRKEYSETQKKQIRDNFMKNAGLTETDRFLDNVATEDAVRQVRPEMQGFAPDETYRDSPVEQGFFADLGTGIYNSFVDLAEGVGSFVPTVAAAGGNESKFFDTWIDGVDRWAESKKAGLSDKGAEGLANDFGNLNAWGAAIGQGLGFIGQIFATAGVGGAIAKGASATSRLGRASKFIGGGVQKAGGARAGSFMAGTLNMYPALFDEAKKAGLQTGAASRFALSVASIVAATEGAALEWIGKSLSKPVTSKLAKESLNESIVQTAKRVGKNGLKNLTIKDLQHVSATAGKNFATKMKAYVPKMTEGAAVEFGQEFTQTYIEQGAKQLYDKTWGEKAGGEGNFGVEIFKDGFKPGKDFTKTFREALAGGLVGGLIGGGLGFGGSSIRGVKGETLSLAVSNANGNEAKLGKIHNAIDNLRRSGKIDQQNSNTLHKRVEVLNDFHGEIRGMGIESPTAQYQMYQMINLQDEYNKKFDDDISVTDDMNEVIAQTYNKNASFGKTITDALNQEVAEITEKKSPVEWNKGKFEQKLDKYENIYNEVLQNKIKTKEDLNEALGKINKNFAKKLAEEKGQVVSKFGKTFTNPDGIKITQIALDNAEEIKGLFKKQQKLKGEEKQLVLDDIKERFGIDSDALAYLYKYKGKLDDSFSEIKKEVKPKKDIDSTELIDEGKGEITNAFESGQIDKTEHDLLIGIENTKQRLEQEDISRVEKFENEKLLRDYKEDLEDYNQKKLEKKTKFKESQEERKDQNFELYKDYYEDEDSPSLENELQNLMTGESLEKDNAQRIRKINYINNLLNNRELVKKRRNIIGREGVLAYLEKLFSEELDNEVEEFYIAPSEKPSLFVRELLNELTDVRDDISNDIDIFNTKDLKARKKEVLKELDKTINDIENELAKRKSVKLGKDDYKATAERRKSYQKVQDEREKAESEQSKQDELDKKRKKSQDKIKREDSKATVNEDTGKLELNLKAKKEEAPKRKKKSKEKKPTLKKAIADEQGVLFKGIAIGNYIVDVIGNVSERFIVRNKNGKRASIKKAIEILSKFSMDDKNLSNTLSTLTTPELEEAERIINDYSVSRLSLVDETAVEDSLEHTIFQNLRGPQNIRLKRTKDVPDVSTSFVVGKNSKKEGVLADDIADSIMDTEQFEHLDQQDIVNAIYEFVKTYSGVQEYNESRTDSTSEIATSNISDQFQELTHIPLTEENIGKVSTKVEEMLNEIKAQEEAEYQELKDEVQEEELSEIAKAETGQAELGFVKQPTQQTSEVKEGVSDVFNENPELSAIGTEQQYSEYLETIFPDSKVKDVFHHWSVGSQISDKFGDDLKRVKGIWLSKNPEHWKEIISNKSKRLGVKEIKGHYLIINSNKVWVSTGLTSPEGSNFPKGYDTIVSYDEAPNNYSGDVKPDFKTIDDFEAVIKSKDQIHILGSKEDIEGFKDFVEQPTQEASEVEEGDKKPTSPKEQESSKVEEGELQEVTEGNVEDQKPGIKQKVKDYLAKTKGTTISIKDGIAKSTEIIAEKKLNIDSYTKEEIAIINETVKNLIKMVPQVGAALAPIPGSATALQIAKNKIPVLEKILSYSFEALNEYEKQQETIQEQNKSDQASIDRTAQVPNPYLKHQRVDRNKAHNYNNSLIKDNLKLYNKIKEHFKKLFPHIPLREVNRLGEKYGAAILARIVQAGIEIDKNSAIQSSLIHEYAHVYLEVLGENHPLVKAGMRLIEGTQFDEDAKRLYPIGETRIVDGKKKKTTRKDQLNEALTEAIAQDSLEKLRLKFEGSKMEQFKEFAKRFWKKIKSFFSKPKSRDIVGILSEGFALKNKPFSVGLGSLKGMSKDQRKDAIIPRFLKTVDTVHAYITQARLSYLKGETEGFNPKSKDQVTRTAIQSMMNIYYAEKSNLERDDVPKIFEGVDLDYADASTLNPETYTEKIESFTPSEIKVFGSRLRNQMPDVYKRINKTVNSMLKTNIEVDEILDIAEDKNQDDDKPKTDNSIKKVKIVNPAVKSIITSIVTEDGDLIDQDIVYQYLGYVAENTKSKADMMARLNKEAKIDDVLIAKRILAVMAFLNKGQQVSLERTIKSFIQEKYEGLNTTRQETTTQDEDGREVTETKVIITNPIRNKDDSLGGKMDLIKYKLDQVKKGLLSQDGKELKKKWNSVFGVSYYSADKDMIIRMVPEKIKDVAELLKEVLGLEINESNIGAIIEEFKGPEKFYNAMNSQYESFNTFFNGKGKGGKVVFDNISGYVKDLITFFENKSLLAANFLNGAGNSVSTTQAGHWISQQNAMLIHDKEYQEARTKDNPIYKNNKVLQFFVKRGFINNSTLDSNKNLVTNNNEEYDQLNDNEFAINLFLKFASNVSTKFYSQTLGVKSNRTSVTYFETPRYSNQELKENYESQAKMLQGVFNEISKDMTPKEKNKLIEGFKNMYLHNIDEKGNITSGYNNPKFNNKIKSLQKIIEDSGMVEGFKDKKIGQNNLYSSLEDMVRNFYFTEALNRNYLQDLYGGVALYYKSPQKSVKRMSGTDSNGEIDEVHDDVFYIFHDGSSSDSMEIKSPNYAEAVSEEQGDFEHLGINAKDMVFQVGPDGRAFFSKRAALNLKKTEKGHNLSSFGEVYNQVGNLILKIQNYAKDKGKKINISFSDINTMKGTYEVRDDQVHNLYEMLKESETEDGLMRIMKGMSKVKIINQRTPHQLNKTLPGTEEQIATFGSQGAVVFLENASPEIAKLYKDAVIRTLRSEMKGVVDDLMNHNKTLEELIKDQGNREKSPTTDLLEAIIKHNNNPANKDNKIKVYDDPNIRLIFEQFIASRLTKRGIKINMPGIFAHQLPDLDGKYTELSQGLEHGEVRVGWKYIFNEPPTQEQKDAFLNSDNNKISGIRIPTSGEVSMFAGKIKSFLDNDDNAVVFSDGFVRTSDSDHDGDKVMLYRRKMDENGNFIPSPETTMVNYLHQVLNSKSFVDKQQKGSLDFEKKIGEKLKELEINPDADFSIAGIDDMVKVAGKMKFGAMATGREAIASKVMSLLFKSESSLIDSKGNEKSIYFFNRKGQRLYLSDFNNKSAEDISLLLQAALDIGNNPILVATGLNPATIDVANTMMMLQDKKVKSGLDLTDAIEFVNRESIKNLSDDFAKVNSVYDNEKKVSLKQFMRRYTTFEKEDGSIGYYEKAEIKNMFGDDILSFVEFHRVANDIAKAISFVQLDKQIPNNSQGNRDLQENIIDFPNLSFKTRGLTNDPLYKWRMSVVKDQGGIYDEHLLTSGPLNSLTDSIAKQTGVAENQIKKVVKDQIMHSISQNQLSKKRDDVSGFIHELSKKMRVIQNISYLNNSTIEDDVFNDMHSSAEDAKKTFKIIEQIADLEGNAKKERIEKSKKYKFFKKHSIDEHLEYYEAQKSLISNSQKFKGNSVFEYLQFDEVSKKNKKDPTQYVMKLDKNFKATSESLEKFEEDFIHLQKLDPELAQEIIDYQLYRWGTNNKRGSFIDGLPMSIKTDGLIDATKFKEDKSWVNENKNNTITNVLYKNRELLPNVSNIKYNRSFKGDYIVNKKDNRVYKAERQERHPFAFTGTYNLVSSGTFQGDQYFSAYDIGKASPSATQEQNNAIKTKC